LEADLPKALPLEADHFRALQLATEHSYAVIIHTLQLRVDPYHALPLTAIVSRFENRVAMQLSLYIEVLCNNIIAAKHIFKS
jgi:hypothetical protein